MLLVRLESLPASRASSTGTHRLAFRQANHGQTDPSSLVLDLSLRFTKGPGVHTRSEASPLPVALPVERSDPTYVLQYYRLPVSESIYNDPLGGLVEKLNRSISPAPAILGGDLPSHSYIISLE